MRKLTFIIALLFIATTAHAQVELLPADDRGPNVYTQINEHSFAAGFQFDEITAGASYNSALGEEGVFVDVRIAPTIVDASGLQVIGGVGGAAGFLTSHQKTKTNWSALYGLRFKSIEITRSHVYHFGEDYNQFTLRWYMD